MDHAEESAEQEAPRVPAPSGRTTRAASRASAPLVNPAFVPETVESADEDATTLTESIDQSTPLMDVSYPDISAAALYQDLSRYDLVFHPSAISKT